MEDGSSNNARLLLEYFAQWLASTPTPQLRDEILLQVNSIRQRFSVSRPATGAMPG